MCIRDRVYAALESVDRYPAWWPEIRTVRQLDDTSGEIVCRAWLPYQLRFTVRQVRRDPVALVLEASMTGDLEGTSCWTITETADGSEAVFDEEVVANKALLRRLAPVSYTHLHRPPSTCWWGGSSSRR